MGSNDKVQSKSIEIINESEKVLHQDSKVMTERKKELCISLLQYYYQ